MKAAILEHYGAPENFIFKDLPNPKLEDGHILVSNKATSVNPVDTGVRQGAFRVITGLFGDILVGSDFSGIVLESKSEKFKPGDEVYGTNNSIKGGSYAEVITAPADFAAIKPANISFTEAASLPVVALTAWQSLVTEGMLKAGDKVLILGCTGGVGSAAVQIAKSFGAEVTGACSAKNSAFARELGVDNVIDYQKNEVPKGKKFDLIFDASGNYSINDMKDSLTDEAMFVSTRGGTNGVKGIANALKNAVLEKRSKIIRLKPSTEDLDKIKDLVETGKLKPYIAKTFPFSELAASHRMQEKGGFIGKIAVAIA